MSELSANAWSLGSGLGGGALSLAASWPTSCVRHGPFGDVPTSPDALGQLTGDVSCTNLFGTGTFELTQGQSIVAGLVIGALLFVACELYLHLARPAPA